MKNNMNEVLNKSVPIDTPIIINAGDLIEIFQNKEMKENMCNILKQSTSYISNLCNLYMADKLDTRFFTVSMQEDGNKILTLSVENYYMTFHGFLKGSDFENKFFNVVKDNNTFISLKNDLKSIKNEKELRRKYPALYGFYKEELEVSKNLLELDRIMNDKSRSFIDKMTTRKTIMDNFKEYYPNYNIDKEMEEAKKFNFNTFINKYINLLEVLRNNEEEIINYLPKNIININSISNEDVKKLELYIASLFIDKLEYAEIEDKQRYVYYLTTYFSENKNNETIKYAGKKISRIKLYEKYKKIMAENPKLMALNFKREDFTNMTVEEVEEFMNEYLSSLSASWQILPQNNLNNIENKVIKSINNQTKNLDKEEREKKKKDLLELYLEKRNFYDSTDPNFRIFGINTFEGYIGHLYKNGLVILEKFYDNVKSTKIADNEAIYIMGMDEFYYLSKKSKKDLIDNKLCKRIYHRGSWQDRVQSEIDKVNTKIDTVKETEKLIAKNKIKKINI